MQKREIMALIAKARAQGYSINEAELEDDLVSVSVPVFNRAGIVVAALNASTSAARADTKKLTGELTPKLKAMAAELASMLP